MPLRATEKAAGAFCTSNPGKHTPMYEKLKLYPCPTCGIKIYETHRFCSPSCEKYQHMFKRGIPIGEKPENYQNYYKRAFWRVTAGSEDYPKRSLYVG